MPAAISLRARVAVTGERRCRHAIEPPGRDPALEVDQILQRDRDTVQRADRVAGADRLVGRFGRKPRVVAIDVDKGVQLFVMRGDAREQRLDDIDRRQAPRRDLGGEAVRLQIDGIGIGEGHYGTTTLTVQ